MALQLRQALALLWVPQDDLRVIPAARKNLAVGRPGDCPDKIAAIFSNVREHIYKGHLRLSPAERGVGVAKTVTLTVLPTFCLRNGTKQTKVPVAFQRRQALARFHVPDLDSRVPADTMVLPSGAKSHAKTKSLPFF